MHDFAMPVDLSDFFNDARSLSLVLIDASFENVKDLQDHIQRLFQLSDISLLTKDGFYLPPKETIEVVKSIDSLKAFHLKVSPCPEERTNKKRRKASVEVEFASSTPNPKRLKNRIENGTTREMSRVKELSVNKTAATNYKTGRQLEEQPVEEVSGFKELSINKTDDTYQNAKRTTHKGNISNSHNNFQEEGSASAGVSTTEKNNKSAKVLSIVSFRCPLLEQDANIGRVFKQPRKPDPVEIIESIVIPAADKMIEEQPQRAAISSNEEQPPSAAISSNAEGSQMETIEDAEENIPQVPPSPDSEDDIMVLNESNVDDSDSDVETVPLKNDGFSEIIADMLKNSAPLKEPPNIGDTVIFKLSRSKGATAPFPTTEFLAGTCSYINKRTKLMTLSVIACADHNKSIISNQYSNKLDDSTDTEIVLSVNFKEMIEPKLIVSTVD